MLYPAELIERIRMDNDIISLISEYVKLQPKGDSHFGLCPFHSEHTPSFNVSAEKQLYYCFGCGASGNVVSFVMQKENYDFPTAIKYLADRAGIILPEANMSEAIREEAIIRKKLIEIHKLSARFYYECLIGNTGASVRDYLEDRGVKHNARIKYGIGYSPNSWNALFNFLSAEKGYSEELLFESGLFFKNKRGGYVDKFRNRLMFPIFDYSGNIVGFGARALDDDGPKYLNSSETKIFEKSRNLYSLNFARKENPKELFIVEGYMDVISLYQAGFKNVVASLGTAFNKTHAAILKKFVSDVILVFDSDKAGEKAAIRAIPVLTQNGLRVRIMQLKGAKDPDEFITKFGADEFRKLAKQSMSHVAFNIKCLEKEYDLETNSGKIDFTIAAAKLIKNVPSEIEREVYLAEASTITGISDSAIKAEVKKLMTNATTLNRISRNHSIVNNDKLKEKGLIEARKSIICFISSDIRFLKALREILSPKEIGNPVYERLLKAIYDIYDSGGNICPADLINHFENTNEQKEVSDIFINTIIPENINNKLTAFNDYIRAIKKAYIDNRLSEKLSAEEIKKLMDEKGNFEKLYISL